MILFALKIMLLYLIEIGKRLRRCLKRRFRRFTRYLRKAEPSGEPVLKIAEEESAKHSALCKDLEDKCAFVEEQKRAVNAKIETYRVLKRSWKKLLTGLDYSIRSSMSTNKMIEKAESILMSAKRNILVAQMDFDGSRKVVERYEEVMRELLEILDESGLVQLFPTDDMADSSRINVPLFHIVLLREEVFFIQKLLDPKTRNAEYGSPRTWEEFFAMYKEDHQH